MGITLRTAYFNTDHPKTFIPYLCDSLIIIGLKITWPAGARIKFASGLEQWRIAADTIVGPALFMRVILAGEGCLCPVHTTNIKGFRG